MLKKLLRYDFAALIKVWGIGALTMLALSVLGGFAFRVLESDRDLPTMVTVFFIFVVVFIVLGMIAFPILTVVFVFKRYQKNFFSDEGYLTFTLPVKRTRLILSKCISAVAMMFLTYLVMALAFLIILMLSSPSIFDFLRGVRQVLDWIWQSCGYYSLPLLLEGILLTLLCTLFFVLHCYLCITVSCLVAKKARVILSVFVYYLSSGVFSWVVQNFMIYGWNGIFSRFTDLTRDASLAVFALVLLGLLFFVATFCTLLYLLQYYLLDRKLNLD